MAGDHAPIGHQSQDSREPPPLFVLEYIERYTDGFEVLQSFPMHFAGDVGEIRNVCTERRPSIAIGAWIK